MVIVSEFENEKIISQFVGIIKCCDRVSKNDKRSHIPCVKISCLAEKNMKIWDSVYVHFIYIDNASEMYHSNWPLHYSANSLQLNSRSVVAHLEAPWHVEQEVCTSNPRLGEIFPFHLGSGGAHTFCGLV